MTEKSNTRRRQSDRFKAFEPTIQMLKREFQRDDGSRNPEFLEDALKILRTPLLNSAALYFQGFRDRADCDPEEATQDLLIKLPLLFGKYGERRPFFPTLLTALRSICLSKMRRAYVRRVVELPTDLAREAESHVDVIVAAETRELDRRQLHRAWRNLKRSGTLTRDERRSLFDGYWKAEKSKQSGQRRGIEPGTVNTQRHQGRGKLRKALNDAGFQRR